MFLRASGRRRRKQAQTTRLASFGRLVSFFFFFLSCLINSNNLHDLDTIHVFNGSGEGG